VTAATATRTRVVKDSSFRFAREGARPSAFERSDGGRLTLGGRLESVWEGLAAGGRAVCPVCTEEMVGGGVCRGCGSRLS